MAQRNNCLLLGKKEPLAGCQGFKWESTLNPSVCCVVPSPPILTSPIPSWCQAAARVANHAHNSLRLSIFSSPSSLVLVLHLPGDIALCQLSLIYILLYVKQVLQVWMIIETEIFLFQSRKTRRERTVTYTTFEGLVNHPISPKQGVKCGIKWWPWGCCIRYVFGLTILGQEPCSIALVSFLQLPSSCAIRMVRASCPCCATHLICKVSLQLDLPRTSSSLLPEDTKPEEDIS